MHAYSTSLPHYQDCRNRQAMTRTSMYRADLLGRHPGLSAKGTTRSHCCYKISGAGQSSVSVSWQLQQVCVRIATVSSKAHLRPPCAASWALAAWAAARSLSAWRSFSFSLASLPFPCTAAGATGSCACRMINIHAQIGGAVSRHHHLLFRSDISTHTSTWERPAASSYPPPLHR